MNRYWSSVLNYLGISNDIILSVWKFKLYLNNKKQLYTIQFNILVDDFTKLIYDPLDGNL